MYGPLQARRWGIGGWMTDEFIKISIEKLFPPVFHAITNPHLTMPSKSTGYVCVMPLTYHSVKSVSS